MSFPFTRVRSVSIGALCLVAAAVCAGQQKFPLRPGEWEVRSEGMGQRVVSLICMTNAVWRSALTQDPVCTAQGLSITSKGMHYVLDCPMETMHTRGPVDFTFDGMEHMVSKASLTVTAGGKTTTSQAVTDFRWKRSACSPADVNVKPRPAR